MVQIEGESFHPAPVNLTDSVRLASTVLPIFFIALLLNFILLLLALEADTEVLFFLIYMLVIATNVVAGISILYKVLIDSIAIGIYRGNNPDESRYSILDNGEEATDILHKVECVKCFKMLNVPDNYDGRIKCPHCEHIFSRPTTQDPNYQGWSRSV